MVKKEFTFSDGTRIFYEEKNGTVQRFIEYSKNSFEREQAKKITNVPSKVRRYNAGKFYYLGVLFGIAIELDYNGRLQLYSDLEKLHDRVGREKDSQIINKNFLQIFGKYWPNDKIQCAAFFTTVYLAMLDLEEGKRDYPNALGKTMVLKSCEAVILKGTLPEDAATMFQKRNKQSSCKYHHTEFEHESRYEEYNGYNGYDDDTIDIGFDGFPEATWNVD